MNSFRLAFTCSIFILCSSAVYPCTCEPNSARWGFRNAQAIFVGEFLSYTNRNPGLEVNFKIEKQWKGHRQNEISAVWDGPVACGGFIFEKGQKYLVYAHGKEMLVDTACDRTARLEHATDDINRLNSFWFRFFARAIPFF